MDYLEDELLGGDAGDVHCLLHLRVQQVHDGSVHSHLHKALAPLRQGAKLLRVDCHIVVHICKQPLIHARKRCCKTRSTALSNMKVVAKA